MQALDHFGTSRLVAKVYIFVKDIGYAHDRSKIISVLLCAGINSLFNSAVLAWPHSFHLLLLHA